MEDTSKLKEAMFYESVGEGRVQCHLCARNCIITEGKVGACSVRKNIGGKLYSLIYGLASAVATDPVEKKPLYHFFPGSSVLSFGTVGCCFRCEYCQNWHISQVKPGDYDLRDLGRPESIPSRIRRDACDGVAFTYNEPTIWYEFAYDASKIVKEHGYYTIFVTNGYMNPEPLRKLAPYLDAMNIDLKCFRDELYMKMSKAHIQPVLDTLVLAKELGIHIEVTNLIVPEFNDDPNDLKNLSEWIVENLGPDVPIHFTRYHPDYHYDAPPTPLKTLIQAYETAKNAGLNYVYLGNIMKTEYENTRCPGCSTLLVKRRVFFVERLYQIKEDKVLCPKCGTEIPIVDHRRKVI